MRTYAQHHRYLVVWIVLLAAVMPSKGQTVDHTSIADISSRLAESAPLRGSIAQQTWFFTHASVGGNIITGMNVLHVAEANLYPLTVHNYDGDNSDEAYHGGVEYDDANQRASDPPAATTPGTIYECQRGNPGWPDKITIFENSVKDAAGYAGWHSPKVNVVMNKLCWIDNDPDPSAQAAAYLNSMSAMEAADPSTVFVYMTMPLTAGEEEDNVHRNQFNAQVRAYCASHKKVLYDLADIQAWSDGPTPTEQTFVWNGKTYQKMDRSYAVDAAGEDFHLNEKGRRRAALGWYATAAAIASKSPPSTQPAGKAPPPAN